MNSPEVTTLESGASVTVKTSAGNNLGASALCSSRDLAEGVPRASDRWAEPCAGHDCVGLSRIDRQLFVNVDFVDDARHAVDHGCAGSTGGRLPFGGDYNPEQWPRETWAEDVAADARGRRHPRHASASSPGRCSSPRRASTTSTGSTQVAGPAARGRHRGRPGHRHRVAAALAVPQRTPRSLPVRRRRPPAVARRPAGVLPQLAGRTASARCALVEQLAAALRRPPGAGDVARRATSTAATTRTATATCSAAAFRSWLRRPVRATSTPSTTRGARRSGASATPTGRRSCRRAVAPTVRQPDPAAGLPPVLLRRAAGELLAAERDVLHGAHPGHPGHHELHGPDASRATWTTGPGPPSRTSSPTTTT